MAAKQRVSANAVFALKEALSAIFWFKKDLYSYVSAAVQGEPTFLAGIEFTSPDVRKRDSVSTFVDRLVREQDDHQDLLLGLMSDVAARTEFPELLRVEDPEPKIAAAQEAVERLRAVIQPYEQELMRQQEAREQIDIAKAQAEARRATSSKLAELRQRFMEMWAQSPQRRGYLLESLLRNLFEVFDLGARAAFKTVGEQIDGGFILDGTHFLLEAKFEKDPATREALDVFKAKVERKAENTLGLFVAIEGFETSAISTHSQQGSALVLMDGADLLAVLEERIDLPDLLRRKLAHASMAGEVFLSVREILGA